MVFVAMAIVFCLWLETIPRQETVARIKVENDGAIVNGINRVAASAMPYDPYFIQVNQLEHVLIPR